MDYNFDQTITPSSSRLKKNNFVLYSHIFISNLANIDFSRSFDKQKVGEYHALRVDTFNVNEFHTLDSINNWMADMAHHNSKFVLREIIGKTVENRDIYVYSVNKNQAKTKVIVEAGIHGHEWMTVAFVTYLFNELIHCDSSKNPAAKHLAYNYHWLLIPVANPDGYDYTHKTVS